MTEQLFNQKYFQKVAEGTMNRLCAGDPIPTARNLMYFHWYLWNLAVRRCITRVHNSGWWAMRDGL